MSQEFRELNDLFTSRERIKIVGSTDSILRSFGQPIRELFRQRASDNFRDNFSRFVRNRHGGHNTAAYRLAEYLGTGSSSLEAGVLEEMRSERDIDKACGALVFDMVFGFREVLNPIIAAHAEYSSAARHFEEEIRLFPPMLGHRLVPAVMESWAEWRNLLIQDPTGFLLVDRSVREIRQGRSPLSAFVQRNFVLYGARLYRDIYHEFYPMAEEVMSSPARERNPVQWLLDRIHFPFFLAS